MTTVTLTEAKARLTKLLTEVVELGEEIVITRSGRPTGVLLSFDDYEGLLETLEILADPDLSRAVKEGLEDIAAGRIVTHRELWDELDDSVRR